MSRRRMRASWNGFGRRRVANPVDCGSLLPLLAGGSLLPELDVAYSGGSLLPLLAGGSLLPELDVAYSRTL